MEYKISIPCEKCGKKLVVSHAQVKFNFENRVSLENTGEEDPYTIDLTDVIDYDTEYHVIFFNKDFYALCEECHEEYKQISGFWPTFSFLNGPKVNKDVVVISEHIMKQLRDKADAYVDKITGKSE